MKITLLAADLAQNSLGRVILLAQALARDHQTHIVGPCFGRAVWRPAENCGVDIVQVRGDDFPAFAGSITRILKRIDAPLVVACKPLLPSFGVSLLGRLRYGYRVIVDIDDDELAMTEPGRTRPLIRQLRDPVSHFYTRRYWSRIPSADGVFSIAEHYQRQFGGVIVPHAKDTDIVDPALFSRSAARGRLALPPDAELIAFVGTPRPHKGIDQIVEAIRLLRRPRLKLLIVGAEPGDSYVGQLLHELPDAIVAVPPQPTSTMPQYLAAADLVVLPQRRGSAGHGQVPAKLFDAMAMGKPIVASDVGGLPSYLGQAGVVVPPEDVSSLARAIESILSDRLAAQRLGAAARALCVERYSFNAVATVMNHEIDRALAR